MKTIWRICARVLEVRGKRADRRADRWRQRAANLRARAEKFFCRSTAEASE